MTTKVSKALVQLDYATVEEHFIAGEADHTAAINRALAASNRVKLLPGATYQYSSTITVPANKALVSDNPINSATLRKLHNGTGLVLSSYAAIEGVTHDGNSTTGDGIAVNSGFGQSIKRVKTGGTAGRGLVFAQDAGGGAVVDHFEGTTTDLATHAVIALTKDTGAVPRFFSNIWLAGGTFDIRGSGNGCSLVNFYISRLLTGMDTLTGTTKTGLMHIANGRISGGGAARTYTMDEVDIVNVAMAEAVTLDNCQGVKFVNSSTSSIAENAANCQYNEIYDQTRSYNPVWNQSSGTQPAIGNGTITAVYKRNGSVCEVYIEVEFGSTTTYGNNLTAWQFSLPFNAAQVINQRGIAVHGQAGATDYTFFGTIAGNTNIISLGYQGQSVRLGYPAAWATGNRIAMKFSYFVR